VEDGLPRRGEVGRLDRVGLGARRVEVGIVRDLVAAAEVVRRPAGGAGVEVDRDTGRAVRVADRSGREDLHDPVERRGGREPAGHVVHLDEEVLLVRVRAQRGQVHVDHAVAVGVVPVRLPGVRQCVAVGVGRGDHGAGAVGRGSGGGHRVRDGERGGGQGGQDGEQGGAGPHQISFGGGG
jgi:hypothetical protein